MHVNDKGQLVTSSNLKNINLKYYKGLYTNILDGGKIYSKYADFGLADITLPSLGKLMNNVTEFTFAGWLHNAYSYELSILNDYILLSVDNSAEKLTAKINGGDKINITSFYGDGKDHPWKHIAIVLHNRKLAFYINGIKQIDEAYQEYNKTGTKVWYDYILNTDDLCLILNQAVWTDNFTPPEEPLLGDLKYETELWPENTIISDHGDPGNLLVKLY